LPVALRDGLARAAEIEALADAIVRRTQTEPGR
jgi:hypothetical protein